MKTIIQFNNPQIAILSLCNQRAALPLIPRGESGHSSRGANGERKKRRLQPVTVASSHSLPAARTREWGGGRPGGRDEGEVVAPGVARFLIIASLNNIDRLFVGCNSLSVTWSEQTSMIILLQVL